MRIALPPRLASALRGVEMTKLSIGMSGDAVYRLADRRAYLKVGRSLRREYEVLTWLQGRLPVPSVMLFCRHRGRDWLLLEEIRGSPFRNRSLIPDLGRMLRRIHRVPVRGCPFDQRLDRKIEAARRARLDRNLDPERRDRGKRELLQEVLATRPSEEDLVFTHGDFCLPNVIIHRGWISGVVDWGRAGVADRYQDLALVTRSLGEKWERAFYRAYGLFRVDESKVRFYRLLDEFF